MRSKALLVLTCLLASTLVAQNSNVNVNRTVNAGGPGDERVERKKAPEPTALERKRGLKLMEATESSVRAMDPATQALALVQIAHAYTTTDKKKATLLLQDALRQSQDIDIPNDDRRPGDTQKERIQRRVLAALMELDPLSVEAMLNDVDSQTKTVVLKELLRYYSDGKQDARAIELLEQLTQLQEMPYDQAANLMSRMGDADNLELRRLFTDALNSYDLHDDPKRLKMGGSAFPDLIVKFHSKLPPSLVRQACESVLSHAKKGDEEAAAAGNSAPSISVASAKGSAQFDSRYDLALANLYPTIADIDSSWAEQLLKEHREAQVFLAKYPTGLPGLMQDDNAGSGGGGGTSVMVNDGAPRGGQGGGGGGGGRGQGGGGPRMPSNIDMERMAKIGHDAQTHPQDAMAQVPMLPDVAMQAQAYIDIARTTMKKDSATAHSALRKAVDLLPKINLEQKPRTATEIAGLYERMGDKESAKSAVEKSMDIVSEVYKQDADPEDPNKAPKWFWPSTAAWRSSMVVATRLDPAWASGLLKDIPDDDIRALNQLAIASETLKIPMRLVEVMELHKDSARMMISQED